MKKYTGTVQTAKAAPASAPPTIAPPVPTIQQDSLINILPSIMKRDGTRLINHNEAFSIISLKFDSGESILTMTDRYFTYEVINMIHELGFTIVYNFLNAGWEKIFGSVQLRKKILFENPLLEPAREKFALDMEIFRNRVDVTKGAVDCKKCGSEETISVEKQIRSADEPMTIRVTCLQCKHKWTAQ